MIRIITGTAKNTKLKTPNIPNFRSVQEIAKNSLFNIIGHKIAGAACLDLYAGSGNLGLEALSQGASWCDFVDKHPEAQKTIQENIKKCNFIEKAQIFPKDAVKYVSNTEKKYDLIFVDPFYQNTSHIFLTKNMEEILNPLGLINFFHAENLDMESLIKDTNLKIVDHRSFGQSHFTILQPGQ